MHPRTAELLRYLDHQREALRAAVERVPAGQREKSPEPGRWSVAEILEHLSRVEASITRLFTVRLAEARERGLGAETETTAVPPHPGSGQARRSQLRRHGVRGGTASGRARRQRGLGSFGGHAPG